MKIIESLPPRTRYGVAAIDTELFGLRQAQLHRPAGRLACLVITLDGKTVYLIEKESDVEKALARIAGCRWVLHNAQFDLRHLRRWANVPPLPRGQLHDTMVVERVLWGGYFDFDRSRAASLQALARRWLGLRLDKDIRKEFHDPDATLTDEMKRYAAQDAAATWKLFPVQERFLDADPPSRHIWEDIDCPALWAILDFKGFKVSRRKWAALADAQAAEARRLEDQLGFNPNSWQQVKKALAAKGVELPDTSQATLEQWRDRYPLIEKILAARGATKRAGTYGRNIIEMIEADGRLYAEFNVTGAETGRSSSSDPNLQNIPRERAYRECFVSDSNSRLIILDYQAQEPRLLACASNDAELLAAFARGEDVHLAVTQTIFHDSSITKADKDKRALGKAINLASSYGMTAYGLSEKTGLSEAEAGQMLSDYFNRFRGVKFWIGQQRSAARRDEFVRTLAGRRIWMNVYSRQCDNNAINGPIQGSAADLIKLAIAKLHATWLPKLGPFPVVAQVHDELVCEVGTRCAAAARRLIVSCMIEALQEIGGEKAPLRDCVKVHVGKSWADK